MPRATGREVNRGGRPSKYTTPRALALVAAAGRGTTWAEAARSVGLAPSTVYGWLARGRAGDPDFAPLVAAIGAARGGRSNRGLLALLRSGLLE